MSDNAVVKAQNSPTAWFAVLERAKLIGDRLLERRAVAQLKRLGVSVRFEQVNNQRGGSNRDHPRARVHASRRDNAGVRRCK